MSDKAQEEFDRLCEWDGTTDTHTVDRLQTQNEQLRSLIRRLTTASPWVPDREGEAECYFCGGAFRKHYEDCAYLEGYKTVTPVHRLISDDS